MIFHYLVPAGTVRDDVFVDGIFYIVGQGFIRLMQMLVVPLVFCSIVCGAASIGDTKTLGTVGVKTLIFYICTTAIAVGVALSVGNLISPGKGVDMSSIDDERHVHPRRRKHSVRALHRRHPFEHHPEKPHPVARQRRHAPGHFLRPVRGHHHRAARPQG